jgi:HAD superfamily hydrolase (TIGR01509 family)
MKKQNKKITKEFGVIFDMDGVLVDSTKYIWDSFNKLLELHGIHFSDKEIKKYLGLSLRDQVALWKKEYGVDIDYIKFSKEAGEMELNLMKNKRPNKSMINLLNKLKNKKVKVGIGTSSLKWRADRIINLLKIKKYFLIIISSEEVINHKPNPDLFLKVAERMNIPPENCVVIEDAASGIEAAKRGNMKAIGFLTNYNNKSELKKADLIIQSFLELSYNKLKRLINLKSKSEK